MMDTDTRPDTVARLNAGFGGQTLEQRLSDLAKATSGRRVFTTSFGMEDQAITDAIFGADLPIEVVTLDTGRLFEETYSLWSATEARYGRRIQPYYPDAQGLEALVGSIGINGFYDSKPARLSCCHVRKVEPLERALSGASVWVTGLRAEQNASRQGLDFLALDGERDLLKANPLLDWTQARLDAHIAERDIPVNALHAKGYPSIGCSPCTRAVAPGEDPRAGRWWWENEEGAAGGECGLHVGADGRLTRTKPFTP